MLRDNKFLKISWRLQQYSSQYASFANFQGEIFTKISQCTIQSLDIGWVQNFVLIL